MGYPFAAIRKYCVLIVYTYEYDFTYSPSLPVVQVNVRAFGQNTPSMQVNAIIDSGSDGSMVPVGVLRRIKARKTGQVIIRTITGARSIANIYEVQLRIGSHNFSKVRVAADKHNKMIVLGRDVLNHLVVTLNGLAAATEIHE